MSGLSAGASGATTTTCVVLHSDAVSVSWYSIAHWNTARNRASTPTTKPQSKAWACRRHTDAAIMHATRMRLTPRLTHPTASACHVRNLDTISKCETRVKTSFAFGYHGRFSNAASATREWQNMMIACTIRRRNQKEIMKKAALAARRALESAHGIGAQEHFVHSPICSPMPEIAHVIDVVDKREKKRVTHRNT